MKQPFLRAVTLRALLAVAPLLALPVVPALAQSPAAEMPAAPVSAPPTHELDLSGMDTSVKPGDDFYRYANGYWLDTTTIPAEYPRWSTFDILHDSNLAVLRAIAEHATADTSANPNSAEERSAVSTAAAWTRRALRPMERRRSRRSSPTSPLCMTCQAC